MMLLYIAVHFSDFFCPRYVLILSRCFSSGIWIENHTSPTAHGTGEAAGSGHSKFDGQIVQLPDPGESA